MFERKIMSLVAGLGALLVLAVLWDAFVKPPHRAPSAAPPVVVDTARSVPPPPPPPPPGDHRDPGGREPPAGCPERTELHGAARPLGDPPAHPRQRGIHVSERGRGRERGFRAAPLGQPD